MPEKRNKKIVLMYIAYQIIFFSVHLLIHLVSDDKIESIISNVFSTALFVTLVCITKPRSLSLACIFFTQIVLYLLVICHPTMLDGWLWGYHIEGGAHGMGNGVLGWNLNIYDDALFTVICKLILEIAIFVLCVIVFAIKKRIKKAKAPKTET